MYKLSRLTSIARTGLLDLMTTIRQVAQDPSQVAAMRQAWGSRPRLYAALAALFASLIGIAFARYGPEFPFKNEINWSTVAVAIVCAIVIRRYLFRDRPREEDLCWLATSLISPVLICVIVSLTVNALTGSPGEQVGWANVVGQITLTAASALGIAAAITIGLGALCFSRAWPQALVDLAVRLLVFKIMIWVTVLVLLEIGFVGRIVAFVVHQFTGWSMPGDIKQALDSISTAAIISTAYLAIVGGTWMVCRERFGELLRTGHVDVLAALNQLSKDPQHRDANKPAETD